MKILLWPNVPWSLPPSPRGVSNGMSAVVKVARVVDGVAPVEDADAFDDAAYAQIEQVVLAYDGKARGGRRVESFRSVLDKGVIDLLVGFSGIEHYFYFALVGNGRMVLGVGSVRHQ